MVALQIANALGVTKSEIVELDESKTIEVIGIKKVPVYDAIRVNLDPLHLVILLNILILLSVGLVKVTSSI